MTITKIMLNTGRLEGIGVLSDTVDEGQQLRNGAAKGLFSATGEIRTTPSAFGDGLYLRVGNGLTATRDAIPVDAGDFEAQRPSILGFDGDSVANFDTRLNKIWIRTDHLGWCARHAKDK